MFFDSTWFVEHLAPTVSGQETYQNHPGFTGGFKMNLQPASPELTAMAEGQFFKTFKGFTTTSGIVEGFRVTASGTSDKYIVRGREVFTNPPLPHYELVLEKGVR